MKIECIKERLQEALYYAEKITSKNLSLPVLSCVYLSVKGNILTVKATNLDLGIEIKIPVKAEKDGIIAVPGPVLNSFVSSLLIERSVKLLSDGQNLFVLGSASKATIKGMSHEDFPTIPTVSEEKSFKIDPLEFSKGLKSVWYSSAVSSIKPELSSVFVYSDDDNLTFAATDSFRLAEKKVKLKKAKEIQPVLIPIKNVSEILRVLEKAKEEVVLSVGKNQISFSFGEVYLTSRVIDGVFPDYKQIIPKDHKTEAVVLKEDFIQALRLAHIFSDSFSQVNFSLKPEEKLFIISTKNNALGENTTKIEATLTGETVESNFNYKYITDCLPAVESDSVSISFSGPTRPLIIRGISDRTFTYLVMPMNK